MDVRLQGKSEKGGWEFFERGGRMSTQELSGYMSESTWDTYPEDLFDEVTYNPYKHESFRNEGHRSISLVRQSSSPST